MKIYIGILNGNDDKHTQVLMTFSIYKETLDKMFDFSNNRVAVFFVSGWFDTWSNTPWPRMNNRLRKWWRVN